MRLPLGRSGNGDRNKFFFFFINHTCLLCTGFTMYMNTYAKIKKIFPFSTNFAILSFPFLIYQVCF